MANLQKYTKNGCANLFAHYDRSQNNNSNKDIDESKTNLNYNLAENHEKTQNEILQNRLSQVKVMNRKDVNVMCSWIVTLPKDYKITEEKDEKDFFQATYNFLKEKYKAENVISAWVHKDEKTPHLHFSFVPVVKDKKYNYEKVSAKELITRNELRNFHQELQNYLEKKLKKEIPILNGATVNGNLTIKELKMGEKEKDFSEKLLKVEEAEKSVFEKKQIFEDAEKKTDELLKENKAIKTLPVFENLNISSSEKLKNKFPVEKKEKNYDYALRILKEVYNFALNNFNNLLEKYNKLSTTLKLVKQNNEVLKKENQDLKKNMNEKVIEEVKKIDLQVMKKAGNFEKVQKMSKKELVAWYENKRHKEIKNDRYDR